ncbi:hypothetical protein GUY40_16005 [Pseudomonas sp. R5(2019)]|nr:hypothetical protein [Pseudomonas sp. R5(2019)]
MACQPDLAADGRETDGNRATGAAQFYCPRPRLGTADHAQVAAERFRQDLYYGVPVTTLSPQALAALKAYHFPGNVRELENILERACTLCDNAQIEASDLRLSESSLLPVGEPDLTRIDDLEAYLESIERKLILQALEETRWNRTAAAQRLSLSFRSMRYRLKKLGLD